MSPVDLTDPAVEPTVAVIGGGVIGSGWILHFLRMGLDVRAFDPVPAVRERLPQTIESFWPLMEEMGLRPGASPQKLRVAAMLEEAVADADAVQEAVPEVLEAKQELFATLDRHTPEGTVLLSSTSGLSMTAIQERCRRPERTVVGHPFNPPYLVPLVEVLAGERTDPAIADWAVDFYARYDKRPLKLDRYVPAFIASRLQEAMWREALHMIKEGEATVEQIDSSVCDGPGLRWAITGPIMNFHLAGGEGGIAHVLEHFGPTLAEPWTRLQAPELDDELQRRLIEGCEREAGGRSVAEMVLERDRALLAIMRARAQFGAGQ
ncbi:MAG TPA: 3-hydroxyacyl-CoA dehydrogenase NAD-binding domain-containing protein [Solirubrobacteraceae bacterium]|jgi:carnitine 3-dehydrogenase